MNYTLKTLKYYRTYYQVNYNKNKVSFKFDLPILDLNDVANIKKTLKSSFDLDVKVLNNTLKVNVNQFNPEYIIKLIEDYPIE